LQKISIKITTHNWSQNLLIIDILKQNLMYLILTIANKKQNIKYDINPANE